MFCEFYFWMDVKSGKSEVGFALEYLLNQRKTQNYNLLTKNYLGEMWSLVINFLTSDSQCHRKQTQ